MKTKLVSSLFVLFCIVFSTVSCPAEVETQVFRTLKLASPPIDLVMAKNGQYIFALTEAGFVEIYGADGNLVDTVNVGKTVDQIEAGPREDILLLKSRSDQTVQILSLEFVQEIDIAGSPVKGPETAPVAVVVFSDFQ